MSCSRANRGEDACIPNATRASVLIMQLSRITVSVELRAGDMILASGSHLPELYLPEISHPYRVRSEASHYARPFYTWGAENDGFVNRGWCFTLG